MHIVDVICFYIIKSMMSYGCKFKIRWNHLTETQKLWATRNLPESLCEIAKGNYVYNSTIFSKGMPFAVENDLIATYSTIEYLNFLSLFKTSEFLNRLSWYSLMTAISRDLPTTCKKKISFVIPEGYSATIFGRSNNIDYYGFILTLIKFYCNKVNVKDVSFSYFLTHLDRFCFPATFYYIINAWENEEYLSKASRCAQVLAQGMCIGNYRMKIPCGINFEKLTIF